MFTHPPLDQCGGVPAAPASPRAYRRAYVARPGHLQRTSTSALSPGADAPLATIFNRAPAASRTACRRSRGPDPGGTSLSASSRCQARAIYSSGNTIYINGHLLAEHPYTPRATTRWGRRSQAASIPHRVPPGEFYVLGDNRADSCDSPLPSWGPAHPGLPASSWHRQGDPGHLAQQPSRPPRPLTRGPSDIAEFPGHGVDCAPAGSPQPPKPRARRPFLTRGGLPPAARTRPGWHG